jgi:hypothetical protein
LAVVARYSPALVRPYTGRSPALVYTDMAAIRLVADTTADRAGVLPSAGMETDCDHGAAEDRDHGAAEALDPTATTHFAHQKERTLPVDSRRHVGVDSDLNCARVVQKDHAETNSQHAVEDTHTVEAWVLKHQASSPNFRTAPEKRN